MTELTEDDFVGQRAMRPIRHLGRGRPSTQWHLAELLGHDLDGYRLYQRVCEGESGRPYNEEKIETRYGGEETYSCVDCEKCLAELKKELGIR